MATFDSIVNAGEWLSDFYFSQTGKGASLDKRVSDRVNEWRKLHVGDDKTPVARLSERLGVLAEAFVSERETPEAGYDGASVAAVAAALGYPPVDRALLDGPGGTVDFSGWVSESERLATVWASPITDPEQVADARLQGEVFFAGAEAPDWRVGDLMRHVAYCPSLNYVVVFAGAWVVLTSREAWPQGRFLAVNLQVVAERLDRRKVGEVAHSAVLLARENVALGGDGTCWWDATLAESQANVAGVSSQLREAIRSCVEVLGNDVVSRAREAGEEVGDGQELAEECLRFLYRFLFVLFAEAHPELGIVPVGSREYDEGYSTARLAELALRGVTGPRIDRGSHYYRSFAKLVDLIRHGHVPARADSPSGAGAVDPGLTFRHFDADLFAEGACALIERVGVSNRAMEHIVKALMLTPAQAGRQRGFISYAQLGVNQLGEVYEELMSYSGLIADTDVVELGEGGKDGSWLVPASVAQRLPEEWVLTETVPAEVGGWVTRPRRHAKGSFVFRQSNRDRQSSASFYTPQVLTGFVVSQALEELRDAGRLTCAADVLGLRVLEPAMGAGAFAIEAVRQLAELYLRLRSEETGETIDPQEYQAELQRVKARIALHQVYGVDLNAKAVELAEITLWLETMDPGLEAPWFGLHVRRGNALVGARHALYAGAAIKGRDWLKTPPSRRRCAAGDLFHFVLPAETWGATAGAKGVADAAGERAKALKAWRKQVVKAPKKADLKRLAKVSERIEQLWEFAHARIVAAERQVSREIPVWGETPGERAGEVVTRREVERDLFADDSRAYRRLRLVMDAWCALTFWPLDAEGCTVEGVEVAPPDLGEWIDALERIVGRPLAGAGTLDTAETWEDLNRVEDVNVATSGAGRIDDIVTDHPWLAVCQRVAKRQAFFHWDLDFSAVMEAGGFDLQVGNPPWGRPRSNNDAILAEFDPWFALAHKPKQADKHERRHALLEGHPEAARALLVGEGETAALGSVLSCGAGYPHLTKQQPDFYRGFIEQCWRTQRADGVTALIHPDSHFVEKKAGALRSACYLRLRRHWHFINELKLFGIGNGKKYSCNIYGSQREEPGFLHAASLYHPRTVVQSLAHDGSGPMPGTKTDDNAWDLSPHAGRIQRVDLDALASRRDLTEEPGTPPLEARMVYTVNNGLARVLARLTAAPRLGDLGPQFSRGWDESIDRQKGYFEGGWAVPERWEDAILQGGHLGVATPLLQRPNPTLKNNRDWIPIDLEAVDPDYVPATGYQRNAELPEGRNYDEDYGTWSVDVGIAHEATRPRGQTN